MEEDVARLKQILDACPAVPAICLDVANGYSEHFVEFVKTVRSKFPEHIIMVCKVLPNKQNNNIHLEFLLTDICYRVRTLRANLDGTFFAYNCCMRRALS